MDRTATETRQSILLTLLLAVITVVCIGCEKRATPGVGARPISSSSPGTALTVVSYGGGAYQESHKTVFCAPFAAANNLTVHSVSWGAEYSRLKDMVESGTVSWDVVEVTAAEFSRGLVDKLFEPLSMTLSESEFKPLSGGPTPQTFGVPNVYWSTVLAFPANKLPAGSGPTSWKDFYDTAHYPGDRALYDDPRGNLEFALLADGVTTATLYPLDVERAFRKLDTIKPRIRVWWKDGTEPVQLLLAGQVAMTSAWSGRIFASQEARTKIGYSWTGAAHELDYWVIPRGSKSSAAASSFIQFASLPDNMAKQAGLIGYGPANALALDRVDAAVRSQLPTFPDNWTVSFVIDAAWWAAHEQELKQRWIVWKNK